jgi:hypothetical protein
MNLSELVKKPINSEKQKIKKDSQFGHQFLLQKIYLVHNIVAVN